MRRRETAIRLALGASGRAIYSVAVRRIAAALALGVVGGVGLGFAFSRSAHAWLGTAAPASVPVYTGAPALLGLATLTAVTVAVGRALRATPSRLLTTPE